jgi:hypothetical protein
MDKPFCPHCGNGAFSKSGFVHQRECPDYTPRKIDFCWDSTMDALRHAVRVLPDNTLSINPRGFWELYIALKERRELPLSDRFLNGPADSASPSAAPQGETLDASPAHRDVRQMLYKGYSIDINGNGEPMLCKDGDYFATIWEVVAGMRTRREAQSLLHALETLVKHLADGDEEGLIEHAEPMIAARSAIKQYRAFLSLRLFDTGAAQMGGSGKPQPRSRNLINSGPAALNQDAMQIVDNWLRITLGGVDADNVGKQEYQAMVRLVEYARGAAAQGESLGKPDEDLLPHLRQFRHNDGSGLVAGYDCAGVERLVAGLRRKADSASPSAAVQGETPAAAEVLNRALNHFKAGEWVHVGACLNELRAAIPAAPEGNTEGAE